MDMDCQKNQDNLSAYLDGELPAEDARQVERHVEECAVCRDLLRELRSVADVLGEMPHESAPTGLTEELQSQIERRLLLARGSEDREPVSGADRALARERPPVWPRVAAVAACLLLAVGVAVLLHDRLGRTPATQGPGAPAVAMGDKMALGDKMGDPRIAAAETETGQRKDLTLALADDDQQVARDRQARKMDVGFTWTSEGSDSLKVVDRLTRVDGLSFGLGAGESGSTHASPGNTHFYNGQEQAKRQAPADVTENESRTLLAGWTGEANTLVLEMDEDDPAVAEAALKKVLADNGLTLADAGEPDLRQGKAQPAPPVAIAKANEALEADVASGRRSKDMKDADKAAKGTYEVSRGGQPTTVLVYAGPVSTEKASHLAYDIAGRSSFRVSSASRGLFVNTAEIQQLRLAQDRARDATLVAKAESPSRAAAQAAPGGNLRGNELSDPARGPAAGAPARTEAKRSGDVVTGQPAKEGQKDATDYGRNTVGKENSSAMRVAANESTPTASRLVPADIPAPSAPAAAPAREQYDHKAKAASAAPATDAPAATDGTVTRAMAEAMKFEGADVDAKQRMREGEKIAEATPTMEDVRRDTALKGEETRGEKTANAPAEPATMAPEAAMPAPMLMAQKPSEAAPAAAARVQARANGTPVGGSAGEGKLGTKGPDDTKQLTLDEADRYGAAGQSATPPAQPANATYIVVQLVVRPMTATAMERAANKADANAGFMLDSSKAAAEKAEVTRETPATQK